MFSNRVYLVNSLVHIILEDSTVNSWRKYLHEKVTINWKGIVCTFFFSHFFPTFLFPHSKWIEHFTSLTIIRYSSVCPIPLSAFISFGNFFQFCHCACYSRFIFQLEEKKHLNDKLLIKFASFIFSFIKFMNDLRIKSNFPNVFKVLMYMWLAFDLKCAVLSIFWIGVSVCGWKMAFDENENVTEPAFILYGQ